MRVAQVIWHRQCHCHPPAPSEPPVAFNPPPGSPNTPGMGGFWPWERPGYPVGGQPPSPYWRVPGRMENMPTIGGGTQQPGMPTMPSGPPYWGPGGLGPPSYSPGGIYGRWYQNPSAPWLPPRFIPMIPPNAPPNTYYYL
ncbi:MAG: hypothetical protein KatS3mg087_1111 [Patescibacteria group bacterium]|nr:MAG: hypothetical protein KatS3mg087_1111 [Patescibacteria group bacterium]